MNTFWIAVKAVFPFLIFISLGYGTRRSGIADESFLNRLNVLLFRVFAPILMFYNLVTAKGDLSLRPGFLGLAIGSLLLLIALLLFLMPKIVRKEDPCVTATLSMFWSNNLLFGIPMAQTLFGQEAVAQTVIMITIIIPIYNTAGALILGSHYGAKSGGAGILKNIITNPVILGTLAGIIWVALRLPIPDVILSPLGQLAGCYTPMALFVLGGTLHFSSLRKDLKFVSAVLCGKHLLLPALLAVLCLVLPLSKLESFMLFTMYGTPVGSVSYSLTSAMGGDGELSGEMVVLSTAVSIVTIFLWIMIFRWLGLF